jgi:hypothetical protein
VNHCSSCNEYWPNYLQFPCVEAQKPVFHWHGKRNSWMYTCVTFHWLKDCLKTNSQWTGRRPLPNLFLYFRLRGELRFITPAGGIIASYPHFFPCFPEFLVTSSLSTASVLVGQGINPPFHSLEQLQLLEFNLPAFFQRPSSRYEAWKVCINWISCLVLWSYYCLPYRILCSVLEYFVDEGNILQISSVVENVLECSWWTVFRYQV